MLITDHNSSDYQTTITLSRRNTDEQNAQLLAWHYHRDQPAGSLLRLDLRATPEFASRVRDILIRRYDWTVELEKTHLYFIRKPKK